jgi:hypothetical protein
MTACIRCHRTAPPATAAEFLQWDPVGDDPDSLICPDCLTPDEEAAAADEPRVAHIDVSHGDGYL